MTNKQKQIEKRFKMLYFLASEIGVWEDKMEELAMAIDTKNPQAEDALSFYEDKIIEVLELKE